MKQRFDGSPFLEMWTKPKKTIEKIIQKNLKHGFVILCFFYGFVQAVHFSQILSFGEFFTFWMNLFLVILLAIPIGAIYFTFSSLFFYGIGKLIKGQASYLEVRAAVSWSNVTQILSACFVIMMVAAFQNQFFYRGFVDQVFENWALILICIFLLAQIVLSVWTFVLFVCGIAQVQKFSIWMALLNVLLVAGAYFVLIVLLGKFLTYIGGNTIGVIGRGI